MKGVCAERQKQLGQSRNCAGGLGGLLCAHQGGESILCPAPSLHRRGVQAQRGAVTHRVAQPGWSPDSLTVPTPLCSGHHLLPRAGFSDAGGGRGSQFLANLPTVEYQEHPFLASGQPPSSKP